MTIDSGATAWVLVSAALVLLMTPAVAFFYGGMVRAKNVLAMLMQSLTVLALVSVVWVLFGFSIAFGPGNSVLGGLNLLGLQNMSGPLPGFTGAATQVVPPVVFAAFQMMFAIITPALVTGATADRWRFGAFVVFVPVWTLLVYVPVARWVFSPTGWLAKLGALDFAGGTVVHVNAGAAALAMAIVLGRRRGWPRNPMVAHSLPLVVLGASLLWFGWFGFNAGSALRADKLAGTALIDTHVAAAMGLLAWIGVERLRYGRPTTLGAASGAVAGLVAITPCAGYVTPLGALAVGGLAGAACAFAVGLKTWFKVDDSLDVVAVHLGGGAVGSLCVGLFATVTVNPAGADGLFYGGGYRLLGAQTLAVIVVASYSFLVTLMLGFFLDRLLGHRVSEHDEVVGLDLSQHGETAYRQDLPSPSPRPETADPAWASYGDGGVR
ncbi:ammonium transporter [Amycolatopsis sp. H20-H5]|uniref:ammonium transporter n=1 Tax=Amycolatopsis sp. H20-H5 TaxID=3046309 RepID=UPI002DB9A30B|nr:ammonium transporter [Amycolatopsis sp. H20-H5]MEC3982592.1 ammonium transporter [Amycolatopsis sp. H20-H5]